MGEAFKGEGVFHPCYILLFDSFEWFCKIHFSAFWSIISLSIALLFLAYGNFFCHNTHTIPKCFARNLNAILSITRYWTKFFKSSCIVSKPKFDEFQIIFCTPAKFQVKTLTKSKVFKRPTGVG